ncbi:MAG: Rrf2 family transcriptional regulator [Acidobacteriota bacterium]|nr:Rrf2 family transcriptional regulator [Acidobacteriota bacterium]MDH3784459.1 Rrf2 family transcriptional regulator [Acidobacteriota bacterium]
MFSTTSEYALRAIVAVVRANKESGVQARELARETGVPSSYLYKILATLRRSGILSGSRGSHGGYHLGREPHEIPLIDIVSLFEVVRTNKACLLSETQPCDDTNLCSAHQHWEHVQRTYLDFLTTKTIADLASPRSE